MTRLPYDLSMDMAPRVGLIVLQADETIEDEFRHLLPDSVSCLVSRVPSGLAVTPETLRAMEGHLTKAAALFPSSAQFAAVGYACTSGTAEIGTERIAELVHAGTQTAAVSEPVTALIEACRALSATRLGLVSPYVATVSDRLRAVLRTADIETPRFASFDEPLEANVARIDETSVVRAAIAMGRDAACDAVFLSCTNLRTRAAIPVIEAAIGKPVLSSNLVLAWHLCRLAGVDPDKTVPSQLFQASNAD
ncbi:MAG: Asp/Glu racemase [Pseudomonadota bacterium]